MAMIAVLWLLTILMVASVAAIKLLSLHMDVASSQLHGFIADQAAEMGIAIACNPAVKRDDPLLKQTFENGASFEADIRSEGERFGINYLLAESSGKVMLKEMFIKWGIENEVAQEIADALKDWVDSNDDTELNGAEKQWYEDQGRINQPFNRPFYSLEEMRLVKGMDIVERAKSDWRNWFTVWGQGGLNVNEADAEKIAMAADCNVEDADSVVEIVRGADGVRGTEDDQPFQSLNGGGGQGDGEGGGQDGPNVLDLLRVPEFMQEEVSKHLTTSDGTTRIESVGIYGSAKRKSILIIRNRTGKPAILEKKEEVIP